MYSSRAAVNCVFDNIKMHNYRISNVINVVWNLHGSRVMISMGISKFQCKDCENVYSSKKSLGDHQKGRRIIKQKE